MDLCISILEFKLEFNEETPESHKTIYVFLY